MPYRLAMGHQLSTKAIILASYQNVNLFFSEGPRIFFRRFHLGFSRWISPFFRKKIFKKSSLSRLCFHLVDYTKQIYAADYMSVICDVKDIRNLLRYERNDVANHVAACFHAFRRNMLVRSVKAEASGTEIRTRQAHIA